MASIFDGPDPRVAPPAPAPAPAPIPYAPARPVPLPAPLPPRAAPTDAWLQQRFSFTTSEAIAWGLVALLVLVFGLWFEHTRPRPSPQPGPGPAPPAPTVNMAEVGRKYVPILGSTYGDGWLAAADALESGKSVADAQKIMQQQWKDSREKAFAAKLEPVFRALMPEGTDPGDPARRKAVADEWRAFARGLKANQ